MTRRRGRRRKQLLDAIEGRKGDTINWQGTR